MESVSSEFHKSLNPGDGAQRANVKLDSFSRDVHAGGPRSGAALSAGLAADGTRPHAGAGHRRPRTVWGLALGCRVKGSQRR
jgi:hypothetical protein